MRRRACRLPPPNFLPFAAPRLPIISDRMIPELAPFRLPVAPTQPRTFRDTEHLRHIMPVTCRLQQIHLEPLQGCRYRLRRLQGPVASPRHILGCRRGRTIGTVGETRWGGLFQGTNTIPRGLVYALIRTTTGTGLSVSVNARTRLSNGNKRGGSMRGGNALIRGATLAATPYIRMS